MTFLNADCRKAGEAFIDERPADAPITKIGGDGERMQVAPTAVVAAQNRSDQAAVVSGDETQAGVPFEIRLDTASRIGSAQADIFRRFPQTESFTVVGDSHL